MRGRRVGLKRGAWEVECRGERGGEADQSKYVVAKIEIEVRDRADEGETRHNQEGRP